MKGTAGSMTSYQAPPTPAQRAKANVTAHNRQATFLVLSYLSHKLSHTGTIMSQLACYKAMNRNRGVTVV